MQYPILGTESTLLEVLERWPQTLPVFLKHRMACVGCSLNAFCTLQDAVNAYHLNCDSFLVELEAAIRQPQLN